ncbi:hypothetical protein APS67_005795 [Streptomyces sp. AVP053U2]|nr:hypothetical protein APS67_005795 [Streptomyces sp. AVP053U2]
MRPGREGTQRLQVERAQFGRVVHVDADGRRLRDQAEQLGPPGRVRPVQMQDPAGQGVRVGGPALPLQGLHARPEQPGPLGLSDGRRAVAETQDAGGLGVQLRVGQSAQPPRRGRHVGQGDEAGERDVRSAAHGVGCPGEQVPVGVGGRGTRHVALLVRVGRAFEQVHGERAEVAQRRVGCAHALQRADAGEEFPVPAVVLDRRAEGQAQRADQPQRPFTGRVGHRL